MRALLCALTLGLAASALAAAPVLTEAALADLVGHNPDVRLLRKRLESARALQGRLARSFLPKVVLSYGRERFTTGPYHAADQPLGGVAAEVNLFNAGRDRLEDELRDTRAEVARFDAAILRAEVLAELKRTLAHHAYLTEVRDITQRALVQSDEHLRRAQKRTAAGLATATDVLDFRQQKIDLTQELAALTFELGVTRRLLNTLLGEAPTRELAVDFRNAHPDHAAAEAAPVAGAKSLVVRKAELEAEAARLEHGRERRWWAPSVDAYGYAQRFTQKEREYTPAEARNDVTVGLRLTVPLFDGGEGARSAQAAKALAEAKALELRGADLRLQRRSLDAVKRLELAHELIHGAEESVAIMDEYRRGVLSEYTRGVKNSPDVLQAGQRWVAAHVRSAEVKKNYQFARIEAEFLAQLADVTE